MSANKFLSGVNNK